jgi:anthranilate phosphoribosyltransferase
MLDDKVPQLELGALLIAFRIKGESEQEMLGFHQALAESIHRMTRPAGKPLPVLLPAYNGARKLANLLPLLALLLQRHGVPVLLHGITQDPRRVTAAETLEMLGVPISATAQEAEAQLAQKGIAFLTAHGLSPAMDAQLELRWRLGVRSSTHTLAKLVDPFGGESVRVVSVTHPPYMVRMAGFLQAVGARALLMRGAEGEPYANPRRCPRIEYFHDGLGEVLVEQEAGDTDIPELAADFDAATTAQWTRQALAGEVTVPRPILIQAACCLYATGTAPDLRSALTQVGLP